RYRGPYRGRRAAGRGCAARDLGEAVDRIQRAGSGLAGFICESFPSCGGQIVLPPGYLAEAYRTVREGGGVCIADEIQVGFGRVGSHFWGFETRSEEHTSELQSRVDLVCRLLLANKK